MQNQLILYLSLKGLNIESMKKIIKGYVEQLDTTAASWRGLPLVPVCLKMNIVQQNSSLG